MFSLHTPDDSYFDSAEQVHRYAGWFVRMRWMVVAIAALLIFITVRRAHLLPEEVWLPLMGTVAALAALNAVYSVLIWKGVQNRVLLLFQAYTDLLILGLLLHYSGGIENPLAVMAIFHVLIGGIILSKRHCFMIAGAAAFIVAAVAGAELAGILPHYTLQVFPHVEEHGRLAHAAHADLFVGTYVGLLTAILFLTAIFVTSLVERMRLDECELQRMTADALAQKQTLERALETTGTRLVVYDRHLDPVLSKGRLGRDQITKSPVPDPMNWPVDSALQPMRETLEDGQVRVTEIDCRSNRIEENSAESLQVTTAPLLDHEGDISYVVQLIQDITEQKLIQKRMIRAEKLATVGELAGQIAHEVNNPIAIISAKTRILLGNHRDDLTEHTATELEKVVRLSDRVALIAQGLLSYCQPSVARKKVIDLVPALRSVLSMIQHKAERSGIDIVDSLPTSIEPVEANQQELEQIFLNLLLNGLDAMPGGGTLTLDADLRAEGFVVRVSDTGHGIPEADLNRIFDPFYSTKPTGRGTGLGLSICTGLVRNFRGTIDVESEVGTGTAVSVWFPRHVPNQNGAEENPDPPSSAGEATEVNV